MKNKKRSLYREIIGLLVISVLVPLVIVTGSNYYAIRLSINENFKDVYEANVQSIVSIVKDIHKEGTEVIEMLSQEPNAKNIIANKDSMTWIKGTFNGIVKSHSDISNVYLGTIDKKVVVSETQKIPNNFDPTQREWYKKAMENPDKVILTDPYENANDKKKYDITFAKTVKDVSGKIIGVIGIDIKAQRISEDLKNMIIGDNGYAIILDANGNMIAHKNTDRIGKNAKSDDYIKEVIMTKNAKYEQFINEKKYVVFKQKEPTTGYTIAVFIPKEELANDLYKTAIFYGVVVVVALILSIILGINFIKVKITKPIDKIVYILQELSKGNFTVKAEKEKGITREFEYIVDAINNTRNGIVDIITNIMKASEKLKENAKSLVVIIEESSEVGEEVSKAVQQIADGSVHQSEKLGESVSLSKKLGEIVERSLDNSKNMMVAASQAKEISQEGRGTVNSLTEVFRESYEANLGVVNKVEILGKKSDEIGAITNVIKGLTEQTNLLALNASIEAARAGEAGRGFAVVAEEVRKLAEESAYSAEKIGSVIAEIKSSVSEVFTQLKRSTDLNNKTEENVDITKENFHKIKQAIEVLESNINNVGYSLKKIKEDKDAVVVNISEVSAVAEEAAATTEEVSVSSEEQAAGLQEIVSASERLNYLAEELELIVCNFKIV